MKQKMSVIMVLSAVICTICSCGGPANRLTGSVWTGVANDEVSGKSWILTLDFDQIGKVRLIGVSGVGTQSEDRFSEQYNYSARGTNLNIELGTQRKGTLVLSGSTLTGRPEDLGQSWSLLANPMVVFSRAK